MKMFLHYLRGYKLNRKSGQTVVEYVLMLAAVVGFLIIIFMYFYEDILGIFFRLVGMVVVED